MFLVHIRKNALSDSVRGGKELGVIIGLAVVIGLLLLNNSINNSLFEECLNKNLKSLALIISSFFIVIVYELCFPIIMGGGYTTYTFDDTAFLMVIIITAIVFSIAIVYFGIGSFNTHKKLRYSVKHLTMKSNVRIEADCRRKAYRNLLIAIDNFNKQTDNIRHFIALIELVSENNDAGILSKFETGEATRFNLEKVDMIANLPQIIHGEFPDSYQEFCNTAKNNWKLYDDICQQLEAEDISEESLKGIYKSIKKQEAD